ncbi:MAG: hypothetical protein U0892_02435 [Pirellulales bacterium]
MKRLRQRRRGYTLIEALLLAGWSGLILITVTRLFVQATRVQQQAMSMVLESKAKDAWIYRLRSDAATASSASVTDDGRLELANNDDAKIVYHIDGPLIDRQLVRNGQHESLDRWRLPGAMRWTVKVLPAGDRSTLPVLIIDLRPMHEEEPSDSPSNAEPERGAIRIVSRLSVHVPKHSDKESQQ